MLNQLGLPGGLLCSGAAAEAAAAAGASSVCEFAAAAAEERMVEGQLAQTIVRQVLNGYDELGALTCCSGVRSAALARGHRTDAHPAECCWDINTRSVAICGEG